MFKNLFRLFLSGMIVAGMTACSEEEVEPVDDVVNLSATEMANCYIVTSPGVYKFKADNQFNLGEGLPVPPQINVSSACLVWQTQPGMITSVELITNRQDNTPYIQFEVEKVQGNALIAALDEEGNIEWSWHIWMPKDKINSITTATGYDVMTINLGAVVNKPGDPGSYGMLYQWGRKDPFPASATLTGTTATVSAPLYDMEGNPVSIANSLWTSVTDNTLEYATAHPTTVLSNMAQYSVSRDWLKADLSDDSLWGNPEGNVKDPDSGIYVNQGRKTCYDPSPAGWRVAPADVFQNLTTNGGYAWDFEDFMIADTNGDGKVDIQDYNYGWNFMVNGNNSLYFPAAARFDGSYAMLMGSMSGLWGNYWSNSPYTDAYNSTGGLGFCCLAFQVKGQNGEDWITVSPSGGSSRADAFSIRCVRDK